ncbi:hypothetical protein ABZT26_13045 [Streptomyces sp. NPDC005395]|uniref:hypothetical protein n=1 Tax=Streptomyces sp. NPDC005395 TaxID=3157042 RepID=UPI0033BA8033
MLNSPNRRVCAVIILALVSVIVGLVAGIGWVLLGGEQLAALKVGASALAGCFAICLSAVVFVHTQGN